MQATVPVRRRAGRDAIHRQKSFTPRANLETLSQHIPTRLDRRHLLAGVANLSLLSFTPATPAAAASTPSIYSLSATIEGEPYSFDRYTGTVLAIVNIASQ